MKTIKTITTSGNTRSPSFYLLNLSSVYLYAAYPSTANITAAATACATITASLLLYFLFFNTYPSNSTSFNLPCSIETKSIIKNIAITIYGIPNNIHPKKKHKV